MLVPPGSVYENSIEGILKRVIPLLKTQTMAGKELLQLPSMIACSCFLLTSLL